MHRSIRLVRCHCLLGLRHHARDDGCFSTRDRDCSQRPIQGTNSRGHRHRRAGGVSHSDAQRRQRSVFCLAAYSVALSRLSWFSGHLPGSASVPRRCFAAIHHFSECSGLQTRFILVCSRRALSSSITTNATFRHSLQPSACHASTTMTATPNHALQRTAPCVTAPASAAAFPPTVQVPRRTPRSLSLGPLGDSTHLSG